MMWKAALIFAVLVFASLPACENEAPVAQETATPAVASPIVAGPSVASPQNAGNPPARTEPGKRSRVAFDHTDHNFGRVDAGQVVEHVFTFKNVGESVLTVEKVHSS